jgi:hypothetical protein
MSTPSTESPDREQRNLSGAMAADATDGATGCAKEDTSTVPFIDASPKLLGVPDPERLRVSLRSRRRGAWLLTIVAVGMGLAASLGSDRPFLSLGPATREAAGSPAVVDPVDVAPISLGNVLDHTIRGTSVDAGPPAREAASHDRADAVQPVLAAGDLLLEPQPPRVAGETDEDSVRGQPIPVQPEVGPIAGSGNLIQLAATPTREQAVEHWRLLRLEFADLLAATRPSVQRADVGQGRVLHRLRIAVSGERSEAVDLCRALRSRGIDCFLP